MRLLPFLFPLILGAFEALPEYLSFYELSHENTLQKTYKSQIEPHYTRGTEGTFVGENGTQMGYVDTFDNYAHDLHHFIVKKVTPRNPKHLFLLGPSVGWVQQACLGSEKTIQEAYKIKIPLLILRGSEDKIVNPEAEDIFCKEMGSKCSGYEIKGAWHELLVEKEPYREETVAVMLTFLASSQEK